MMIGARILTIFTTFLSMQTRREAQVDTHRHSGWMKYPARLHLLMAGFLAVFLLPSIGMACSHPAGWKPPSTKQSYQSADIVVYLRVISQSFSLTDQRTDATVEVIKALKGEFKGQAIWTLGGSMCGLGEFVVGEEYVLFLAKNDYQVMRDNLGRGSVKKVLRQIRALR